MLGATPTVRTRLLVLVLGVVIPMIVISAGCAAQLWRTARDSIERELLSRAQAVAARAERELEAGRGLLRAFSTSPYLQDGDLRRFYDQVARTPRSEGTNIGLSDASGQMLMSTLFPFGAVLPPPGDLDSLRQVFNDGKPRVSNLYVGRLHQEMLVAIDMPVIRDGHVIFDLRMSFRPKIFSDLIQPINPPESEWGSGSSTGRCQ